MMEPVKRRRTGANPLMAGLPAAEKTILQGLGHVPLDEGQKAITDTAFTRALRFVELVKGKPKPVVPPVKFTIKTGSDLLDIINQVMIATASGRLAPDTAATLINSLNSTNRSIISQELRDQLHELKKQMDGESDE